MPERGGACRGTAQHGRHPGRGRQSPAKLSRDTAGDGKLSQEAVSAHRGQVSRNGRGLWLEAKQKEAEPPRAGAEIRCSHRRYSLPAP